MVRKSYFDCRLAVLMSRSRWVAFVGAQKPPRFAKLTVVEYTELLVQEVTTELGLQISCVPPAVGQTVTHTLWVNGMLTALMLVREGK